MDARTWAVLADAATAKLYQPQASGRDWQLISELTHPQSRAKESELGTDKPGRVKQSTGSRAAMEPPTPRKRVEVEKFARQIAKTLDDALVRNAYDRLVLVAPAEFSEQSRLAAVSALYFKAPWAEHFDPADWIDLFARAGARYVVPTTKHHDGIALFTVGQRKRLGIAAGEPLYVLGIEPERRRVVVGPRAALAKTRVRLGELNWLAAPATDGMAVAARLRSTQAPASATLYLGAEPGEAELVLQAPAGAVAPGQAAVLYDGERVLGGGWIRRPA